MQLSFTHTKEYRMAEEEQNKGDWLQQSSPDRRWRSARLRLALQPHSLILRTTPQPCIIY